MERFLLLKTGMDIPECRRVLRRAFAATPVRKENFNADQAVFPQGVTLFFKPETGLLYCTRFDAPFSLPVGGVRIGNTKRQVRELLGKADRVDPFPFPKTLPTTIWMYGKPGDWIRYDFEKERDGRCVTIYR